MNQKPVNVLCASADSSKDVEDDPESDDELEVDDKKGDPEELKSSWRWSRLSPVDLRADRCLVLAMTKTDRCFLLLVSRCLV